MSTFLATEDTVLSPQAPVTIHGVLQDPTTTTSHEPVYPLSQNHLESVMEYNTTFGGQVTVTSKVDLPAGSHFCFITTQTPVPATTWSSIQSSEKTHFELNSALVYTNHSCAPTLELEVFEPDAHGNYPKGIAGEYRVTNSRDLRIGNELNWFYPSTEWDSPRPFNCLCGAPNDVCIGEQRGSKYLEKHILERYFLNRHVRELTDEAHRSRWNTQGGGIKV